MINFVNRSGNLIKIVNKINNVKNVLLLLVFVMYGNFYIVFRLIVVLVDVKIKLRCEDY